MPNNFPAPNADLRIVEQFTDEVQIEVVVDEGTLDLRGADKIDPAPADTLSVGQVMKAEVDTCPTTLLEAAMEHGGVSKWNKPVTGEGGVEYDANDVLFSGMRGLESTVARRSMGLEPNDD